MTEKTILKWESIGIVPIFLAGAALHFVFEWTNRWPPVAWLAPVNESTWEHFKLGFWPSLLYALVEYVAMGKQAKNFWVGKSLGSFSMPLAVSVLFYGYTAVVGRHNVPVDILIFLLAVGIGQAVSFRMLMGPEMGRPARRCAIIGLAVMAAAFVTFSYHPPRVFLFEDPRASQHGVLEGR